MAIKAAADAAESGYSALRDDGPGWLSRTDLIIDVQNSAYPVLAIETIQPLYMDDVNTWFWQGRLAHSHNDETVNLGAGYRRLLGDNKWMLGTNVFFDATEEYDHHRIGAGFEAFGEYATLRGNLYEGISATRSTSTVAGVETTEKALDGWDFELETPLPYLPWASLSLKKYGWERETVRNVNGHTIGFRLNPTDNFEFEFGTTDDNFGPSDAYGKFVWYFDKPAHVVRTGMNTGVSKKALVARNVEEHRLEKVRRHNDIVIEKRTGGGSGLTVGRRS